MNYCSNCGTPVKYYIPPGDDRPRCVCDACETIHYENPKMVVGCIPEWKEKILLCRRAIKPRYGTWTLPAGYLENGETVLEAAKRELYEEAFARVKNLTPYALFNLSFINEVYLMLRGPLLDLDYMPGRESLEVKLFREEEIPWKELAFSVMHETLRRYFKDRPTGIFPFWMGNIEPD